MNRQIRADDEIAHDGVDAVGADHRIGPGASAVSEGEFHLRPLGFQPHQLFAEVNRFRRHRAQQRVVQVRAVHAQIRRAEQAFGHGQLAQDAPGIPFAVEMRVGLEGGAAQPGLDADAAQHLHRIGHHLHARADARERRGLLVHAGIEARLAQSRGRREPAHAGSHDRDRKITHARF